MMVLQFVFAMIAACYERSLFKKQKLKEKGIGRKGKVLSLSLGYKRCQLLSSDFLPPDFDFARCEI
jgi:hypothetical protein